MAQKDILTTLFFNFSKSSKINKKMYLNYVEVRLG